MILRMRQIINKKSSNELIENIRQLLDQGYKQKDIAILARSKIVIPDIVDSFQNIDTNVSLVSDEAFRLDASLAVNVIIEAPSTTHTPT